MGKQSDFHLSFFQIVGLWEEITTVTKRITILWVFMVLGDASSLETFVWILSHVSRSISSFLFILKSSNFVEWPISPRSFMWSCQIIDYLKFETRPSFLRNFGKANCIRTCFKEKPRDSDHAHVTWQIPSEMILGSQTSFIFHSTRSWIGNGEFNGQGRTEQDHSSSALLRTFIRETLFFLFCY